MRAPANELAYLVRSTLRWRRGAPVLRNEDKRDLLRHLEGAAREASAAQLADLVARGRFERLAAHSSLRTFAGNLQHFAGLERLSASAGLALPRGCDGVVRAVDVGCGDFHYASALAAWLESRSGGAGNAVLRGIEMDGHGVYCDGHSRADHAHAHAALADGERVAVQFQVGDFRHVRLPEQDVVTMFFPFVTAHACLRWGAPVSRLAPRRLFRRAAQTLAPGGWLVVVNQTTTEFERVTALLRGEGLQALATAPWASDLVPWHDRTADQVGSLWRRPLDAAGGTGGTRR